jgi:hypothetical protein
MNFSAISKAFSPEIRMTATPPLPCGVDIAAIVSENIVYIGILLCYAKGALLCAPF